MTGTVILSDGDCMSISHPRLASGCYGIRFNSNDGTSRSCLIGFKHGSNRLIPSIDAGFEWGRAGYSFMGWSESKAGSIVYPDAGWVCRGTAIGCTMDLYGVWKPIDVMSVKAVWREPVFKVEGLRRLASDVEELCVGSSHAHYGYYADARGYNLGDPSCDAYYCLQMLKYWIVLMPSLKRIVYFYDIFNPGNIIDLGREAFRRISWLHFYRMEPQTSQYRRDTTIGESYAACEEVFHAVVAEHVASLPDGYRGNALRRFPMSNVDVAKRVAMHLKLNKGDCDRYVSEMIALCRARNLEIVIVIPPLRSDYMRELPPGFTLQPPKGARIINYMDSSFFVDEDFMDSDHLNEAGAKKLTRLLHEELDPDAPIVSVVMLAYRHERYIAQAIESIIGQRTSFPMELVIGEDASPDATLEICRRYENLYPGKVVVVSTGENVSRGGNGNLLRTCRRCRGKYVAFCEGDDYWIDPYKLQKQVDFMEANLDCTVCFHPVVVHWDDRSRPDGVYPPNAERFLSCPPTLNELLRVNYMQTNSVMFRWNSDGRLFDDFPSRELPGDWKLNLLHARQGRIGFLPDVMAVYRRHADGLWTGAWKDGAWFGRLGFRNMLFYAWMQKEFGVDRRGVLRRLALATIAQEAFSSDRRKVDELLSVARPSSLWVRISGVLALFYGAIARFSAGDLSRKAALLKATWLIVYRGRRRALAALSGSLND